LTSIHEKPDFIARRRMVLRNMGIAGFVRIMSPALTVVFLVLAAIGVAAFAASYVRGRREFRDQGHLSAPTVVMLYPMYASLTVAVLVAAIGSVWPMPVPPWPATFVGIMLVVASACVYVVSRAKVKTFRATWGLAFDQLVTTGPYAVSRNPQIVGAVAFLLGAALLGRSNGALMAAGLYAVIAVTWIRLEEDALERRFGLAYRQYRRRVPRFL
jgi:protein-S-isoprenylcysteine O-methyltransferase Ste14